jgi:tRNA (cytidine/uridine-2'-O-)-methyltransferase
MFNVVLVQPEIPPNTGNVIRLCANTGCTLHLVEPLGFSMEDRYMRRAGLDYHEYAEVRRHASWAALHDSVPPGQTLWAIETGGSRVLGNAEVRFAPGDWLVFGCETKGLSADVLAGFARERIVSLPMQAGQRSLNLSNAVAVTVFEAWRQNGYRTVSAAGWG